MTDPSSRSKWLFRVVAIVVATVGSLTLVEATLWIIAPLGSDEWPSWIADGHILGRLEPNQSISTAGGNEIHTNSLGFRGPDRTWHPPPGTLRIVTLGGSSTFGLDADGEHKTWPSILQETLRDSLKMKVEVINLGLPGYDSATSEMNYQVVARAFHPHVAVIYHTWNDLKHCRALADQPILFPRPVKGRSLWKRLARHTQLARRAARFVNAMHANEIENTYNQADHVPNAPLSQPAGAACLAWTSRNLRDFALLANADGVLPVLVTQATIATPNNEGNRDYRLKIRYDFVHMTPSALCESWIAMNQAIKSVADDTGAVFIDGYSAVPSDLQHLRDHVHLTDSGRHALAEAIANGLLQDQRFRAVVAAIRAQAADLRCPKRADTPVNSEDHPFVDLNLDCNVDLRDYARFQQSLFDPAW